MAKIIQQSGKRKRAIARATLRPGTGKVRVNHILMEVFGSRMNRLKLMEPFIVADEPLSNYNIDVSVAGGGCTSQVEAARLAIARALVKQNKKLEKVFLSYDRQLLVADVRRKESSKPNCRGQARAKKQKSYR